MTVNTARFLVVLREFERGWGSKDFLAKSFSSYQSAVTFADSVNLENNKRPVPDYYITARIITDPNKFSDFRKIMMEEAL
jgi:hypothetical protein